MRSTGPTLAGCGPPMLVESGRALGRIGTSTPRPALGRARVDARMTRGQSAVDLGPTRCSSGADQCGSGEDLAWMSGSRDPRHPSTPLCRPSVENSATLLNQPFKRRILPPLLLAQVWPKWAETSGPQDLVVAHIESILVERSGQAWDRGLRHQAACPRCPTANFDRTRARLWPIPGQCWTNSAREYGQKRGPTPRQRARSASPPKFET